MKILIVEDDIAVADLLQEGLQEQGYTTIHAVDGSEGLREALTLHPDLIILDINLPKLSGLEVCKQIRLGNENIPIIMLTAQSMLEDVVEGLDAGADDYMGKPFRFQELYARIKALTRRSMLPQVTGDEAESSFVIEDLVINFDARSVFRAGKEIHLTAKEYELLVYLAKNKGKIRTRTEIAAAVWDLEFDTGTNFIDVYISYLRNKMDKPFGKRLIHTAVGMGYVLKSDF